MGTETHRAVLKVVGHAFDVGLDDLDVKTQDRCVEV
jgi:hypothetical protein